MIKALKAYGPLYEGGPVRYLNTATGNDILMAALDDTAGVGALLAENADATVATDAAFTQVIIGAKKYTSKVIKISNELIADSGIDIVAEIAAIAGERVGRIVNTHLTTGNGTTQPQGLVTGSTLGFTAAATNAITADDLLKLEHSVDPAYRVSGAGFMFNDSTFLAARLLKDADGRPLWQPSMIAGEQSLINGRPFWINQDIAGLTTAAIPVLFGDFSKFTVRKVNGFGIRRLDERYGEFDQTGFVVFTRVDSKVLDTRAVKHLKLA